ncbi:hypothetical protein KKG29_03925 [Patescibacteria group bacterium]|nr:hypothetical protein [Patescibacteria group bacterium]MBU4000293.1 hypothetical protein [Patescibacteria group bacterium]MBU4056796.1 hypothetical protein [Patescibacteria group bacterium]MBU4368462.1 hypothetical protein [Patescibacteria group bacterium]
MNWCFAVINGKLGEIYFEKNKNGQINFLGHCYVKREWFKTKQEQKCIGADVKKVKIIYRNKKYRIDYVKKVKK